MDNFNCLVLDGQGFLNNGLYRLLSRKDFLIFPVSKVSEAFAVLKENSIDVAVVELESPVEPRVDFIKTLSAKYPDVGVVVLDEYRFLPHPEKDFEHKGIFYLANPFHWEDVSRSIEKTESFLRYRDRLEHFDLNCRYFSQEIREKQGQPIIGVSKSIKEIINLVVRVAESDDTSVLITGESGTGKELVARGIHMLSNRFRSHFYAVNCSAIPDTLFESEFFGYIKGAFTGAVEKTAGWFELADRGTLFLDEITELPAPMQTKFLRVLDDKVIHRIGSHQEIKVDLRILSATNQDLDEIFKKNTFRNDLFHRLNSFHIHIPPLRERKEDIPVLLDHFIKEFSGKMNKPVKPVCDQVIEKLMGYSFPGNVRELRNMTERAMILSEDKKLILRNFCFGNHTEEAKEPSCTPGGDLSLNEIEKQAVSEALIRTNRNKSRAAQLLKISRQALERKIAKFKII
jgi:DNA-binding NtrC family response regulator